jgi:hypothetical protein
MAKPRRHCTLARQKCTKPDPSREARLWLSSDYSSRVTALVLEQELVSPVLLQALPELAQALLQPVPVFQFSRPVRLLPEPVPWS